MLDAVLTAAQGQPSDGRDQVVAKVPGAGCSDAFLSVLVAPSSPRRRCMTRSVNNPASAPARNGRTMVSLSLVSAPRARRPDRRAATKTIATRADSRGRSRYHQKYETSKVRRPTRVANRLPAWTKLPATPPAAANTKALVAAVA